MSVYINFHKLMYSYETNDVENHKKRVYTAIFNASELSFNRKIL